MAFFSSFSERVDMFVRLSVACGFLVLLFIMNIVVVYLPFIGSIKAPLFLMAIYYWAIYRPTLVPLWLVFIAGCLMDLLGATPLGLNALIFVLTQWLVARQRRFLMGQPFVMIWIGFAVLSLMSLFLQWAVVSTTELHWFSLNSLWVSTAFGIALFPPVCIILHLTHKILPAPRPTMRFSAKS